jgi:hypothetical protein
MILAAEVPPADATTIALVLLLLVVLPIVLQVAAVPLATRWADHRALPAVPPPAAVTTDPRPPEVAP